MPWKVTKHLVFRGYLQDSLNVQWINKIKVFAAIQQHKDIIITYTIVCVSTETLHTLQSAATFLFAASTKSITITNVYMQLKMRSNTLQNHIKLLSLSLNERPTLWCFFRWVTTRASGLTNLAYTIFKLTLIQIWWKSIKTVNKTKGKTSQDPNECPIVDLNHKNLWWDLHSKFDVDGKNNEAGRKDILRYTQWFLSTTYRQWHENRRHYNMPSNELD